jgi:hypothetical protein
MSETEMLWKLRQLPREIEPGRDLWPGIAASIQQPRPRAHLRWLAPFALAASVLLTAGIVWRAQHGGSAMPMMAATSPATNGTATAGTSTPGTSTPAAAARGSAAPGVARLADSAVVADRSSAIAGTVVARESRAVTTEYQAALRQFDGAPMPSEVAPALHELDRSVAQIRRAIAADPGSVFLLEQLRRTYELRLNLTQRAALG